MYHEVSSHLYDCVCVRCVRSVDKSIRTVSFSFFSFCIVSRIAHFERRFKFTYHNRITYSSGCIVRILDSPLMKLNIDPTEDRIEHFRFLFHSFCLWWLCIRVWHSETPVHYIQYLPKCVAPIYLMSITSLKWSWVSGLGMMHKFADMSCFQKWLFRSKYRETWNDRRGRSASEAPELGQHYGTICVTSLFHTRQREPRNLTKRHRIAFKSRYHWRFFIVPCIDIWCWR